MAKLESLPDPDTIKKMRGVIDYAVWRGQPYARAWPRYDAYKTSQPMKTQIAAYSTWLRGANQTDQRIKDAAIIATAGTRWTWRDLLCFAVSGNLYGAP